ncbi:MAG: hypothetical protein JXR52_01595 [Bacteroidales bacterium]|nr:hypothetical protein [Bacteroidales bacterium]
MIKFTGYAGFILVLAYLFRFLGKVDISLIYYWQQSAPPSLMESLKIPGGICELAGARFVELLTRPFTGSIALALMVSILFFSLLVIFRQRKENPLYFTVMLAGLIPFIFMFPHYRLPAALIMSLTAGFLLSAIQSLYAFRNLIAGSLYNLLAGIVIYMVAGSAGLLVFVQVILIQKILTKRYPELLTILPVLILPLLYLPLNTSFTISRAYLISFLVSPYDDLPLIFYFCVFVPLLILPVFKGMGYILTRIFPKRSHILNISGIILVLAVLLFFSDKSINTQERQLFKIYEASFGDDWNRVLDLTAGQSRISQLVQFEVNRALYQTGRLLDSLFSYPQHYGEGGLFLEGNNSSRIAVHMSDFYFDMGYANEARHWANEAQVVLMRHPVVLKNLVLTYAAMGREDAALKYLRILERSGLFKDWCASIDEMIETNTVVEDPAINSFILNNPETDFFALTSDPTRKLMTFYSHNPDNKMAFEYLVAGYLLHHQISRVADLLPGFRHLGYEKLPRTVEEAMLIYLARAKPDKHFLADYSISKKTMEDFTDFSKLVLSGKTREEQMLNVSPYTDTYWYYFLFSSPYAS